MQVEQFSESIQPAITALSITPQSPSILIKQTVQLNAVASYANGSTATITSTAEWTSSAPAVATVNGQGLLTCQGTGSSLVSALSGGVTAKTSLTCFTPQITALSITPQSPSILIKQTAQFKAVASYANGSTTDITSTAKWTSNAPAVATVDGQGLLTCEGAGSSLVSVLSAGVTAVTTLTCSTPQITDIHLGSTPAVIRSESPYQYQMLADYSNSATTDVSASTTWVTDPSIASISSSGMVSCNHPGATTVSGTYSGMTAQSSFTCVLHSITPNPGFVESAKTFDGPFASWTDVKAVFGAKGDGITDDTAALQAALNSLSNSTPVLWIPHGTYLITGTLTVMGNTNITILGEDPLTTTIVWGGSKGGTMFVLNGVDGLNLGRITWDGRGATSIALEIAWDKIHYSYPTRNLIHDSRILNSAIGFLTGAGGDSGELTVDRVHFDHNSTAGISNQGTLNFNVIDSLFTDNAVGIWGYTVLGGPFNVTNSVFVRSTESDLLPSSSGPFSFRNNLSFDSQMLLLTGATGAPSNVIIQGNTVYHPASEPMIMGMPGALILADNQFVNLDPSFQIMAISGSPRYFISAGNSYSVSQPFGPFCRQCNGVGVYTSVDEATRATDPILSLTIPTEVYIPPFSHRPVFEVSVGSSGDVIQKAINAAIAAGGIVHLPAGTYNIYQTLTIPPNASVGIFGDGLLSQLQAAASLQGPILSIYGKSVQLEDLGFYTYSTSSSTDQIELHEPDTPNTRIICDECSVNGSAVEMDGIDDAAIEFKVATINNDPNLAQVVHGGIARHNGIETLGSVGEYMTSSGGYQVDLGGHLLIGDGWHDSGQGGTQFVLSGDGSVTQQGGTVYSPSSSSAMTLNHYNGLISLLGIATNSYLSVDAGSTANAFVAAVLQVSGQSPFQNSGTSASITGLSNSSTPNNSLPSELPDTPTTPSYIEQMMAMSRTQILSPRKPISFDSTNVKMTRIVSQVNYGGVGIRIMDSVASRVVGSYLIGAANGGVTPLQLACGYGEISMAGTWTLQDGGDGFYGLMSMGSLLSEGVTEHGNGDDVAMVSAMSSARDRWIITQIGDGSVKITNRATGNVLTQSNTGCAYAASDTGMSNQQWLVGGASAASSPMSQIVPAVTSISPAAGDTSGGTSVTITGIGFTGATSVAFGSTPAGSFTVVSDTSITAVSPAGTTGATVDVTVTNYLGTSATSTFDKFIYNSNSWNNTSWQLRQQITINPALVGGGTEDETNFPVLISLSGLSNINANGSDIRFTASDGVTLLPREIESYAGGTLAAWVKIPTVSHTASTSIYMYYGNTAATEPAATSTYGSQNVWTNGYAGVWHMNDSNGMLNLNDSTANGNNARNNGGVATTTGPIDGAAAFINQIGSALMNTSLDAQPSAIPQTTWSAWVYFTSNSGTASIMSDDVGGYGRDIESTRNGDGKYHIFYGANNWAPTSAPLDQWQFISLAYASNNVYFYRNGVQYTLGIAPTCPPSNTDFNFGGGATGVMNGLITEVHVSSVVRSAGWNSTEYQNQSSPSTFYTVSPTMAQRPATSSPTVSSISQTVGNISGGTSVTITGTGFSGTTAVDFGSTPAESYIVVSSTSITAVSPTGTTGATVDVTVVNSLGTSATSSADQFTYYARPVVTGLSAVSGSTLGGTSVTITGSGFTGTTAVDFGSTSAASFTASGDSSITAVSPAGAAGTVDITVANPVGSSASSIADKFTYSVASTTPAFTASNSETIGVNAMSPMGFSTLPYFKADGTDYYDSSSHDPTGDNGDFGHDLYQDPSNGNNVLLDVKGPGEIDGIWFTYYSPTAPLYIYFDGSSTPAVNTTLGNLLDGANAPFVQPLVGYSNASDTDDGMGRSGYYINLPMEFAKSVKVEMTGGAGYYNIYYRTFATSTGVTTFDPTPTDSNYQSPSAAAALWSNTTVDPKSTAGNIGFSGTESIGAWASSTIASITGVGSVNSIKFQVASGSDNDATLGNIWVEMYFDGQAPSYAPFDMFFAESEYGTTQALPVGKDASGTYYCYFPMPYDQSAKIILVNQNGYAINLAYQVQYNTAPYLGLGNSAGYFSTYYNNSSITPLVAGQNYELLNVTSTKGQYVGMVYTAPYGGYLEGNTEVYVDGSLSPQIQGTGTDNWFYGAYYFQDGPFTQATHGVTIFPATSSIEAYRFDLNDPISFNSSITLGIQHGATDYDGGSVSSLAYYYALPSSSTLTLTDTLAVGSSTSRTSHGYTVNSEVSTPTNSYYYEGEAYGFYGPLITDTGDTMTGNTQFTVAVNPANKGVKLRRRLDYSTLNQKAEVYVNGSLMGIWYDTGQNTTLSWRDSDFEIPAAYTQGKNSLNIEIVYDNTGGTAWTEYDYWAYSYLDIDDTPPTDSASLASL
jgi:hypothetical protein